MQSFQGESYVKLEESQNEEGNPERIRAGLFVTLSFK